MLPAFRVANVTTTTSREMTYEGEAEALPPGVLEKLKEMLPKNENGNRRAKLWQLLTVDTGIPHLDRELTADLTLMQISETKQQFEEHWDKLFGKQPRLAFAATKELKP